MSSTSIRQINPNILTFTQPFSRSNLFKVGLRGSAIRLANNEVFIINPVNAQEDETLIKSKLDELGKVKWIACPNTKHHLYAKKYKEWYPDAQMIGMEGLPAKKKDLKFDQILGITSSKEKFGYESEIESVYFSGFINRDVAFYHRPTKTMFVADLLFNLPAIEAYSVGKAQASSEKIPKSFMNPWSFWQKAFLFLAGLKNRKEMKKDLKKVSEWEFERIVMCHGEIIEQNAKDAWNSAYSWY